MTASRVYNLTFHGVGDPPRDLEPDEAAVWLAEDSFLAALDVARPRADVRVSFDDSNRSDVDVALPALLERGMTATFFVLAGRLDHPDHLGAGDLRTLREAGMTIGSHGLDHRNWRSLDELELDRELLESRAILAEAAGTDVTKASVPFGAYDRRVLGRARGRAHYDEIFTSDGGPARDGAWLQARTSMTVGDAPAALLTGQIDARGRLKRFVKRWR